MIRKYPTLQKVLARPEYDEMRERARIKVVKLDQDIELYIRELLDIVLPPNATIIDKAAAKKVISTSVYLSVYKDRLNSLYEKISRRSSKKQSLKLNHNIERDKKYILSGVKLEDKYYLPKKSSSDFRRMLNHCMARNDYIEESHRISPENLRRYLSNSPHVNIVTELKRLGLEGGNFEDLSVCSEEFIKAEQMVENFRNVLIEKTMIVDEQLPFWYDFKRTNMFDSNEKSYLDQSFIASLNKIRRVVGVERVKFASREMQRTGNIGPFFRSSTELHSGRLYNFYKNPTELMTAIKGILGDSIMPTEENIFYRDEALKHIQKEIRDKYRAESITNTIGTQKKESSGIESHLKLIAGLIGLGFLMYIVNYVESNNIGNENQENNAYAIPSGKSKIYEKNTLTSGITHTNEMDIIEVPDKDGNMTQIKLTADNIVIIKDILEENYLKNQEAELELKGEAPQIEQESTQKRKTATRRRRVDKYRNEYNNSDSIDL